MDLFYNFDKCQEILKFYGGAGKKTAISFSDRNFLVKFPDITKKKGELNSSYSHNVFSEYLGCKIAKEIGFDVQNVYLGTFKGKTVVACEDFTSKELSLAEFSMIENRIIDSEDRGRTPKLENLEKIFNNKEVFGDFCKEAKERYWDIFIFDALMGNFDRHSGNWGYLINEKEETISNAPLYDCGSCLYPQIFDEAIQLILNDPKEIEKRIYEFPKAALMQNEKKVGYKDFIAKMDNKDCNNALLRIMPRINIDKIKQIVDNTPQISDIRKQFYKTMIEARYKEILLEPYRILEKQIKQEPINFFQQMMSEPTVFSTSTDCQIHDL